MSNLDVGGAFDSVPRDELMQALGSKGVEGPYIRYVEGWLTYRNFKVRLRAPPGYYFSAARLMTHGLPHGGVLSPILWLLAFGSIQPKLEATRKAEPEISTVIRRIDLI